MPEQKPIAFKAEIKQLLNILIHSLYTDREIFLRELISNASDALTQMDFVMLTDRDVLDPDAELAIRLSVDEDEKIITISDSGIGMTRDELKINLGTIAQSGAKAFLDAADELRFLRLHSHGEQVVGALLGLHSQGGSALPLGVKVNY